MRLLQDVWRKRLVQFGTLGALLLACNTAFAESLAETVARFEKMGLPNVSRAKYVAVLHSGNILAESLLPDDWNTSGNAWLLDEVQSGTNALVKGRLVINGGEIVELCRDAEDMSYETGQAQHLAIGDWENARLARDVKKALQFSESGVKSEDSQRCYGRIFLFALHLYQRGDTASAEALIPKIGPLVIRREKAERSAMNLLADAQYGMLYRRFSEEHNWAAYRDGIRALLAKYPHEWDLSPAMHMLLTNVAQRAEGQLSSVVATNGISTADIQLGAALASLRILAHSSPSYSRDTTPWLVPEAWEENIAVSGNPDLAIRARGMQAIPILLALAEDSALTEADASAIRGDSYFARSVSARERGTDAAGQYKTLPRPATRGEVAVRILNDILPESALGKPRERAQKVTDLARAFYDMHKDAAPEALAVLYLPASYGSYDATSLAYLMKTAKQKKVPALEAFLLSASKDDYWWVDEYERRAEALAEYAALRGAECKPLIEQFTNCLERVVQARQETDKEKREGLLATAKRLAAMPFDRTDDDLLAIVQGGQDKDVHFERDALFNRLRRMTLDQACGYLLGKAVAADDPKTRLTMHWMLAWRVGRNAGVSAEKAGVTPTGHAEAWKALVADDRVVTGLGDYAGECVSDAYLTLYERLFSELKISEGWSSEEGTAAKVLRKYGALGRTLVRQRVLARLGGLRADQLPKYPGETTLSAEQKAACVRRFSEATSRERAAAVVDGLSIYERVALPEILRENPALNARLEALANTVTRISVQNRGDEEQRLKAWEGRRMDAELVGELAALCEARAKSNLPTLCLLSRKENFGGCEVLVNATDTMGEREKKVCVGYSGLVCDRGVIASAKWRTAPPPAETNWNTVLTSEPDQLRGFQRGTESLCKGTNTACAAGFVRFKTEGDSK